MIDKEKLHQILSSLWRNDDSVGKVYYNQALQAAQIAIDNLQEEPVSEDKMTISKEWFEHCKKSWYNEGYIDGKYNRDRQFEEPISEEQVKESAKTQHIDETCKEKVNSLTQEHVSEDLEDAAIEICSKVLKGETINIDGYEYVVISDAEECFKAGAKWQKEQIEEALLSEVLPCFMHGGEADEVVAKLDEVLNKSNCN